MTRRNALDRLRHNPQDPIVSIPQAQVRKRTNRSWDKLHRGSSYFIPVFLSEQAMELRASILALAQRHVTNTSTVAAALIDYSLTHVGQGRLVIEAHPNARRRKMSLTWEEFAGQPQNIPQPAKRIVKDGKKNIYLNYRWGRETDAQIKGLAGEFLSPGEVVVFLLDYALAAHQSGRLILREESVPAIQRLKPDWS
jgi:hypothetical protein